MVQSDALRYFTTLCIQLLQSKSESIESFRHHVGKRATVWRPAVVCNQIKILMFKAPIVKKFVYEIHMRHNREDKAQKG